MIESSKEIAETTRLNASAQKDMNRQVALLVIQGIAIAVIMIVPNLVPMTEGLRIARLILTLMVFLFGVFLAGLIAQGSEAADELGQYKGGSERG